MKRSKTHREPILLYCNRPTQTNDVDDFETEISEVEDSDFPPCKIGNSPPLFLRSPSYHRYPRKLEAASSSESQPPQSQRRRQPDAGLGQINLVNTVHTKVISYIQALHVATLMMNVKCQDDPSFQGNTSLKRQSSAGMAQDPAANGQPLKRRHLAPRARDLDDHNMSWVRREIAGIKETLEEIASDAREDRRNFNSMLEELDIAGIKENLEEITYEAREGRDNFNGMLEELKESLEEITYDAREGRDNFNSMLEELLNEILWQQRD